MDTSASNHTEPGQIHRGTASALTLRNERPRTQVTRRASRGLGLPKRSAVMEVAALFQECARPFFPTETESTEK